MRRSTDSYSGEERQPLVLDDNVDTVYPPWSSRHLKEKRGGSRSIQDYLFILASISTLLTSALAFYVFVNNGSRQATPPPRVLRRPNPYPNLEKILKNATNATFPPVINFPEIVLQIDTSDSSRRIREDDKGRLTPIGAVYPFHRHILITSEVSTILHLRHLDFAMEDCMLQYIPPESSMTSFPSTIDIWILESSTEISPWFPESWHSAPKRNRRLGSLLFSDAPVNSTRFECPTNEFTTLELSCAPNTPSCNVDFWQNKMKSPRSGLFMIQHSTHSKFRNL